MALKISIYNSYAYNYSLTCNAQSHCTISQSCIDLNTSSWWNCLSSLLCTFSFSFLQSVYLFIYIYMCVVVSLFNKQTKYSRMANVIVFNPDQCLECTMYFKIFIVGFRCVEVMFIYRLSIGMPVMDMNKRLCLEICFIAWSLIGWNSKFLLCICLNCHERFDFITKIVSC